MKSSTKTKAKPKADGGGKSPAKLNRLVQQLNKKHGDGTFVRVNEASSNVKLRFDSGNVVVNTMLSGKTNQGFPSGRIVELYGSEHVGKTTLGCRTMALCQEQHKGVAFVVDTESTLTQGRVVELGVDPQALVYSEERFIEAILSQLRSIVETLAKDQTPAVIFWDTVAGSTSKKTDGYDVGEGRIGTIASALSEGLPPILKSLARSRVCLIACNQLREGFMKGQYATEREKESVKGGAALKFMADARLKLEYQKKHTTIVQKKNVQDGFVVRATLFKNKQGPNDIKGRLVFSTRGEVRGFNNALSVLHTLVDWGLATHSRSTGRFTLGDTKLTEAQWEDEYKKAGDLMKQAHATLEKHHAEVFRGVAYEPPEL